MVKKSIYAGTKGAMTPLSKPVKGRESEMTTTHDGSYVFKIDPMKQLERFLILGTASNTYYATAKDQTKEVMGLLELVVAHDPLRVIDMAVNVSQNGLALKNDPALVVMAVASCSKSPETVRYAMSKLPLVARTGTHLLHFVNFVDTRRGWGRSIRNGIQAWFDNLDNDRLSFQMAKYQQRDGWSWGDVIRLAHVSANKDDARNQLFRWAMGLEEIDHLILPGMALALEKMKSCTTASEVADLVAAYGAPMEIVPTQFKNERVVWEAALPKLGLTAILRNLGNLTRYDVTDGKALKFITDALSDDERIRKARIHPMSAFLALKTYEQGHGQKNTSRPWIPVRQVLAVLEDMVYKCFRYLEPTGLRYWIATDNSGSMSWVPDFMGIEDVPPRTAATVLTLALLQSEPSENVHSWVFDTAIAPSGFKKNMRIMEAVRRLDGMYGGGTNISLAFSKALQTKTPVDVFLTITDNETNTGYQPHEVLNRYRNEMGIHSKSIVLAMTSTGFSVADPKDPDQLDIVGMSADVPLAIAKFAKPQASEEVEPQAED